MTARVLVLEFPGTTCAEETARAFAAFGAPTRIVREIPRGGRGCGAIVLPGGFAHDDRPAPGVAAARTSEMREVAAAARRGVPVLGICNGLQILLAAGLLPGRAAAGRAGRFFCGWEEFVWRGRTVRLPVAHRHGRILPGGPAEVILRTGAEIAGLARDRVWGVMPHPERAVETAQGGTDGRAILAAFLAC